MTPISKLVRDNIRRLKPYSSARKEFAGEAEIFLDANENSFGSPIGGGYNRYPDPLQSGIKKRLGPLLGLGPDRIFVGNGSDEAIDLLFRIFCEPRIDNAVICPPTYGMYKVSADINDVEVRRAPLTAEFALDPDAIARVSDERSKLLFICSPNNPTGNAFEPDEIAAIARDFGGIVAVDEAYVDFSGRGSVLDRLGDLPNVVVLRTFSKAWGLAGLRVGLAFASPEIVTLMNNVKPPYNVSEIAQKAVIEAIDAAGTAGFEVGAIIRERAALIESLGRFALVTRICPTDANFVLVRTTGADSVYRYLLGRRIVVRNRSNVELCGDCLRITVGTPGENSALIAALADLEGSR